MKIKINRKNTKRQIAKKITRTPRGKPLNPNAIRVADDIIHSKALYRIPGRGGSLKKKASASSVPVFSKEFHRVDQKIVNRYPIGYFNGLLLKKAEKVSVHIVIATMIWKRHDIFKLWAEGVLRLIKRFPNAKIDVVVAGSEGKESEELVSKYGFFYVEAPNKPLGSKANIRLRACKQFDPDYVMLVGSDNLFSDKYFAYILNLAAEGYDEIAPLDIYYYDTITKYSVYSNGYQNYNKSILHKKGEPLAPGRMLSKEILEKVNWELWSDHENRFLDKWPVEKVKDLVKRRKYFSCRKNGLVMCDVKSSVNMTKLVIRSHFEILDEKYIKQEIPEIRGH